MFVLLLLNVMVMLGIVVFEECWGDGGELFVGYVYDFLNFGICVWLCVVFNDFMLGVEVVGYYDVGFCYVGEDGVCCFVGLFMW